MRHFTIGVLLVTAGCTSVNMLGTVGPKALQVYSIKDNGVLTASGMLVILNSDGEVAGVVGGTVQAAGQGFVAAAGWMWTITTRNLSASA